MTRKPNRWVVVLGVILVSGGASASPPRDFAQVVHDALDGRPGGVVVMRVSDGRVIATANEDVCCRQLHAPGSIFKLVTAFGALSEGCARENETFRCGGRREVSGHTLHCTVPNGHGAVRIQAAIAQSCNLTFYELGMRLGADRLLGYAELLGLAAPCRGFPGKQSVGTMPRRTVHPADTARLGIGQADGLRITPLAAAEMVRRLVTGDIASDGLDPAQIRSALAVVRRGMRESVTAGTCRAAALASVQVAGKTGSTEAQDNPAERSAWFVGFAPYESPEVVVVVFVKRGRGFDTAAPIAGRVFSAYFRQSVAK